MISRKYKSICKILSYIEHLLILVSTVTGHVSIFAFAALINIPVGIASSTAKIKTCAITAVIRKYKSIIKKITKKDIMKQYFLQKLS